MTALIKKTALLYCLLMAVFTASLIAAFAIPAAPIKKNVAASAQQISSERLWWQPMGLYLFQIDNMTDCMMLSICACDHQPTAARRAMLAEHAILKQDGSTPDYKLIDKATYLYASGNGGDRLQYIDYARYWHGYAVVLRPLLCLFSYWQLRTANCIALAMLAIATTVLLYRRAGGRAAMTFAATLALTNSMIVPLAFQFSTCFYIAMGAMCLVLAVPAATGSRHRTALLFFTVGAVCSFADFLTTPVITLGMPLATLCLLRKDTTLRQAAGYSCSWAGGYASVWASKWILAWAVTGYDVVDNALSSAATRIGSTIVFGGREMPMSEFFALLADKAESAAGPYALPAAAAIAATAAAWGIYMSRRAIRRQPCLALVALMPLVWFAVMKNHSLQHIFFTWRDWLLTLWCCLLMACHSERLKKSKTNTCTTGTSSNASTI